ncbi:microcystin-dependent protein [Acidovorax soli]|uniref:Microcystin-dependent protein n=1 Tax=Acidovorax soli TaxID=592050 RepID=A0A7X0P8Y4_9BURK|nr:tail fiber protein [Acidovorax soli]MBB6557439.1 microcystin-dependent protein [Acidovorax soli]
MDPFVGEIRIFGCNFAPRGWAKCEGQIIAIQQNTALFSLLGTTYGGNGQTTFALPNLQGRAPIGFGQGPGLSIYNQGQDGGVESVTLLATQMPVHTHGVNAVTAAGNLNTPAAGTGGLAPSSIRSDLYEPGALNTNMAATAVTSAGGTQAHDNMPPYLALNFCIALEGIYPSRN